MVIGGGLAGLAAAHRIQERTSSLRRPLEIVVLEAKDRIGGVISTERMDGFIAGRRARRVHHQQAVGNRPLPSAGPREPVDPDRPHSPALVRGQERPACPGSGRVRAHGPAPDHSHLDHAGSLVARQAAGAHGSGDPPADSRIGGEPGVVRPPPAGPRGTGTSGAAASRRHLHRRPE